MDPSCVYDGACPAYPSAHTLLTGGTRAQQTAQISESPRLPSGTLAHDVHRRRLRAAHHRALLQGRPVFGVSSVSDQPGLSIILTHFCRTPAIGRGLWRQVEPRRRHHLDRGRRTRQVLGIQARPVPLPGEGLCPPFGRRGGGAKADQSRKLLQVVAVVGLVPV